MQSADQERSRAGVLRISVAAVVFAVVVVLVAIRVWPDPSSVPSGGGRDVDTPAVRGADRAADASTGRSAPIAEVPPAATDASRRPAHEEPVVLPSRSIDVLVVDPDDTPLARIRVGLRRHIPGVGGSDQPVCDAESGADGRAFLDWSEKAESLERLRTLAPGLRFYVAAVVPLPEPPRAELGAELERHGVVRLVVPRAGALRVHVDDPTGQPIAGAVRCEVFLFWRDRTLAGTDARFTRTGLPRASVEDGIARFAVVPLGQELKLGVSGGRRWVGASATALGPLRPGEETVVRIRLPRAKPTVTGVLVDERERVRSDTKIGIGAALIDVGAPLESVFEGKRPSTMWHTTDGVGRFHWTFWLARQPGKRRVLVVEQDDTWAPNAGPEAALGTVRRAVVDLERELPGGVETDLGTVRLIVEAEPRVIVSGRVVDTDGNPMPGAHVGVGYWHDGGGQGRRWKAARAVGRVVDHDGSFTFRSVEDLPDRLQVGASKRGWISAGVEVPRGASDVLLTLAKGSRLTMSIVVDENVPKHLLNARLSRRGGGFASDQELVFGAVRWDSLPAGVYDLVVGVHGTKWELARVDGITVPAGGEAIDPRIGGIDLLGRCRVWRLRIEDASGAASKKTLLRLRDDGGLGGNARTDDDGFVLAVTPASVGALHVSSWDGETSADVAWSEVERTVRLAPR